MRLATGNCSLDDLRFIARHEYDVQKGFGWEVTITRYRVTYSKQFGDVPYGGKEKALEAAIAFRDSLLALLPSPSPVKFENSLNTSGTVGVCFAKERNKSDRSILPALHTGRIRRNAVEHAAANFQLKSMGSRKPWLWPLKRG